MRAYFVRLMMWAGGFLGAWVVRLVGWFVSTGYCFFARPRVRASREFYQALFPGRGRLFYLMCTWRQFHGFAASYADRVSLAYGRELVHVSEGWENIETAAKEGRGGILVTSHLGNWEVGARLFKKGGMQMTLLMGQRDARQVSRQQKEDLRKTGLDVSVSTTGDDSPFGGLDAVQTLRNGGFVSIAGDIAWTDQRSRAPVTFLDHEVWLPAAPHLLALVSGAPILTVFGFREGRLKHHFITLPPREVKAATRADRQRAVAESAQQYASDLEKMLRRYPWQWYVFESFFRSPADSEAPP